MTDHTRRAMVMVAGGTPESRPGGESMTMDPIHVRTEFQRRLCSHRGIDASNTLPAIEGAIAQQPFFVEFDTFWQEDGLYLGHPPDRDDPNIQPIDLAARVPLGDVLTVFRGSTTLPKIDIKLDVHNLAVSLPALSEVLNAQPQDSLMLINLGGDINKNPGDPTSEQYMAAETYLLANTRDNVRLNVDLGRYMDASLDQIHAHLASLPRRPFSLSPNIEADQEAVFEIGRQHDISHIHFWSFFNRLHPEHHLHELMQTVVGQGFEPYFDISPNNIAFAELPQAA